MWVKPFLIVLVVLVAMIALAASIGFTVYRNDGATMQWTDWSLLSVSVLGVAAVCTPLIGWILHKGD